MFFDAIGGGEITDKLISNLPSFGQVFIYGKLSSDPLVITKPLVFAGDILVTGFMLTGWITSLSLEEIQKIRANFSSLLKK